MGLDTVELVIRIEDTFGVQIPDRVAEHLTTPKKVTDFVLSQVRQSERPLSCLSQRAFYSVRREFTQQLSVPGRQLTPDASLKAILPEERRHEVWKNIGSSLGVKMARIISQVMAFYDSHRRNRQRLDRLPRHKRTVDSEGRRDRVV